MKPWIASLCVAATVGTFVAGCGGSEAALTKAEFVKQADAVCSNQTKKVYNRLSTYVKEQPNEGAGKSQDELFAGAMREILLPSIEAKIDGIKSLNGPAGGQKQIDAYLSAMEKGLAEVQKGESTSYVELNDSLVEFEKPFAPAERIAHGYGMKECPW